ncbi:hypothetical protein LX15_002353 [Streptoalloteichus tenebrarius]|uniref:Uncharacterized protein n=1 Tax=Streptoalloteichus tenebrarius (strain ATCC 17920 / DSM 40477 / JCM 4838 / CBS 697.72 / NBRC 16177 / NCIMB 11028 / NRRL B-12390 / A12253. 1 / ISP 5477) TaxID=1933 RepID=A0ABT1HT11_STRSD|nr:hypothetical protein [Streptoalloteichus tenebrarius]MCP2258655.1 hypothetical protein [Streptoalloteichus tenebrarius]BFF02799.1 hypothetical protein GCM10020241_44740 [Streptoalloteichus tenebrarius]
MDPRERADELLARARARGGFVVTPDSATSPMDAANTVQIPRIVVDSVDPRNATDLESTLVLPPTPAQGRPPAPPPGGHGQVLPPPPGQSGHLAPPPPGQPGGFGPQGSQAAPKPYAPPQRRPQGGR